MPITGDVFTRPTRRSVPVVVASSRRYISQRPIPGEPDMNGRQRNRPNEPESIPPGDMLALLAALFFLLLLGAFVVPLPLAGVFVPTVIAVGLFGILIWRLLLAP